jgi:hypothetical protein
MVALVGVSTGGALFFVVGADSPPTGFWFSVATKATTGTYANDFVVLFGSGTFKNNHATGTGIFSISTALPPSSSNSVNSGTWRVTSFVSFVSFGVANPRAQGGTLVFQATLTFDDGTVVSGVTFTVNCRVGLTTPPPPAEGVTLSGPVVFDQSVAGITTFGVPAED